MRAHASINGAAGSYTGSETPLADLLITHKQNNLSDDWLKVTGYQAAAGNATSLPSPLLDSTNLCAGDLRGDGMIKTATYWRRSVSSDGLLPSETSIIGGSYVFVLARSLTTHVSLFSDSLRAD